MALAGCSKFLEQHSQNASYIESPADLEELLYGGVLDKMGSTGRYLHLLSDESKELYHSPASIAASETSVLMNAAGMFRYLENPFTNYTGITASGTVADEWIKFYEIVAVTNSLIENATLFDITDPQVAYVDGSARFMRAMIYFKLVNTYGEPYSRTDPDASMGVPYKASSKIDQNLQTRQSTGYVYDRIVEDLLAAAASLKASGTYTRSPFKVSEDACHALLSRVYLYMERYGDAAAEADKVEALNLYNLAMDYPVGQGEVFLQTFNPEIIFAQGSDGISALMPSTASSNLNGATGNYDITVAASAYCVSDELWGLFTNDDVRSSAFFALSYGIGAPMSRKFRLPLAAMVTETDPISGANIMGNYDPLQMSECAVLRAAEVVLNKAEAQALAGNAAAVATITEFVNTRYTTPPAVPASGNALIEFIREERRKELCFEGHRWFDLRRYAVNTVHPQTTAIVHPYHATENNSTAIRGNYTLAPYSAASRGSWVLPAPQDEVAYNYPVLTNLDRKVGVTIN